MANVIQIKRNTYTSTGDPTTLAYGELGWNNNNGNGGNLWIGSQRDNNSPATITEELINKPVVGTSSQIDVTESASAFTVGLTANPTVSGNLTVTGNLQVDGTTTTINSTIVTVDDKTFVVADGASASASDGAGFFISDVASLRYEHNGTKLEAKVGSSYATFKAGTFEGNLTGNVTGNVTGDITGDVTGNADTATALETARTIGGVSFNGTANINLPGVNAAGNQNTTGTAANVTGVVALANGGTGAQTVSGARSALGLTIGSDVQAYDADLSAIATLLKTNGNFIVGNGSTWVAESGSTARTSLGLGTSAVLNTAAVSDGATTVATGDQIHTFVTTVTIDGGTF